MTGARFEVLGPLRVLVDGREVELGSAQRRDLLAVLLLKSGTTVARSEIIDALWGTDPPPSAANLVQTYVKGLRQALGDLRGRLVTVGSGYRFEVGEDELDLLRFRESKALEEWRGRCLEDRGDELRAHPWVIAVEAERMAEALTLAQAALAAGDSGRVLPVLRELAELEPLHEELHAQLVLALAIGGMQAEAVRVYQRVRRRLGEELGVDPGPQLRSAYERMLRQDLPVAPVRPPVQAPAQLPRDITDFTGRPGQLAELLEHLNGPQRGAVVVSAIGGRGGVGKSALAVHAAHQVASAFPDGQLHANLRGAQPHPAEPSVVLAEFLRALGVDGSAIPDETAERAALFRSRVADKRILVVLDDAADEAQVRPLLPGATACAVIVTSRARLDALEGAALVDVDVFEPEDAMNLLARTAGAERVMAEAEAAERIVRLCGFLPLAVRIAAARLAARPAWTLDYLAVRLADERRRLDELAIGDLAVRSSLSLSYAGLGDMPARLFRRLGLLAAPDFAGWVAAPLLDVSVPYGSRLIEELVKARLLDEVGIDATGQMRYRLHDLVRLYAREHGEPAKDQEAALERAFGAWLALAELADGELGFVDFETRSGKSRRYALAPDETRRLTSHARAWFEAERANLRAASDQAFALAWPEQAWELATIPLNAFSLGGLDLVDAATLRRALDVCERFGSRDGQAAVLLGLAEIADQRYESDLRPLAERALELFRELDDPRGQVDALERIEHVLAREGKLDEALIVAQERLTLSAESGYLYGTYFALRDVGTGRFLQARLEESARALGEAEKVVHELGDAGNRSIVLNMLAVVACEQRRFEEGEALALEGLHLARTAGHRKYESSALRALAGLYVRWGRAEAMSAVTQALTVAREVHHVLNIAACLRLLSELDRVAGRLSKARDAAEECVAIWRSQRNIRSLALALNELAHVHQALGDGAQAVQQWMEAHDIFIKLGNDGKAGEIDALIMRARGGSC